MKQQPDTVYTECDAIEKNEKTHELDTAHDRNPSNARGFGTPIIKCSTAN